MIDYQCMTTVFYRSNIILSLPINIMSNLSQLPMCHKKILEIHLIHTQLRIITLFIVTVPTTDVFRPETTGSWISLQRFSSRSHAAMRLMTSSGSVALLTSERPLAHADELTNHMKVKIAVTTKSCRTKPNYLNFLHWNTNHHYILMGLYDIKKINIMCLLPHYNAVTFPPLKSIIFKGIDFMVQTDLLVKAC